jgi:hypothetical protein
VTWYASKDRIHAVTDRDRALQEAVDAWAVDLAAGYETGLYAWRRANVAALNQRAREWMNATGRLTGPELVCPAAAASGPASGWSPSPPTQTAAWSPPSGR